jgi:hypothetical protein
MQKDETAKGRNGESIVYSPIPGITGEDAELDEP